MSDTQDNAIITRVPMEPFQWDDKRERAAMLLAQRQTRKEIADELGVDAATLWRWLRCKPFQARVNEHVAQLGKVAERHAIANRERRIRRLQEAWDRLWRVIEERAADPSMADVPGGKTGLVIAVPQKKGVAYRVDTAVLAEMRELQKMAAQECGQWVERQQHELAVPAIDALAVLAQRRLAQDEAKARLTVEATGSGDEIAAPAKDGEAPSA